MAKIPGTLTYSPEGISLKVFGSLHPSEESDTGITLFSTKWVVTPIVHGESRAGEDITLISVGGISTPTPSSEATFRVELALVGQHIEDPSFTGVRAHFDYLAEWAEAPPIHNRSIREDPVIHPKSVEIAAGKWNDADLTIRSGADGRISDSSIHLERWCAFRAEGGTELDWRELFERYARPFHDLLIVSLGRPLSMTQAAFKPSGSDKWCEAYFETRQTTTRAIKADLHSYSSPTLLVLQSASIPASELLPRWFDLRAKLAESLTLLLAPFYAPFTYEEHRYASYFQSLEAFHGIEKAQYGSTELPRTDHRQRVAAVVAALEKAQLDSDVVQWAKNVVQGRNDKPLWKRIEDVVRSTGTLGDELLSAAPNFCKNAAWARTGVSHGGADEGLSSASRHWHGEILLWVMRARILNDLGVPDVYNRARKRAAYQFALDQVRAS